MNKITIEVCTNQSLITEIIGLNKLFNVVSVLSG